MLDEMLEAARCLNKTLQKRGNVYQYHHQTLIHEPAQGLCGRLGSRNNEKMLDCPDGSQHQKLFVC
jgi:hypothetical protein